MSQNMTSINVKSPLDQQKILRSKFAPSQTFLKKVYFTLCYESSRLNQDNLYQLQIDSAPWCLAGNLYQPQAQTTSRLRK
jgi:hypothetical protein